MRSLFAFLLGLFTCLASQPSAEPVVIVDVELVLLADASRSIDNQEINLQRLGYAGALTHRDVLRSRRVRACSSFLFDAMRAHGHMFQGT